MVTLNLSADTQKARAFFLGIDLSVVKHDVKHIKVIGLGFELVNKLVTI